MAKAKYEKWLTEEGLIQLEGWARYGLTDEQIAHNMGIRRSTLNDWKSKYPDISDTLKRGKEVVDIQVENALLKRALGATYEEETIIERDDGYSECKVVRKQIPPDTTAAIFWIKNRKPNEWRDKRETEITGKDGNDLSINIKL